MLYICIYTLYFLANVLYTYFVTQVYKKKYRVYIFSYLLKKHFSKLCFTRSSKNAQISWMAKQFASQGFKIECILVLTVFRGKRAKKEKRINFN